MLFINLQISPKHIISVEYAAAACSVRVRSSADVWVTSHTLVVSCFDYQLAKF